MFSYYNKVRIIDIIRLGSGNCVSCCFKVMIFLFCYNEVKVWVVIASPVTVSHCWLLPHHTNTQEIDYHTSTARTFFEVL